MKLVHRDRLRGTLEGMKTQPKHSKPTQRRQRPTHKGKARRSGRLTPLLGCAAFVAIATIALATSASPISDEPQVKQKSTLSNLMSQAQVESLVAKYKASLGKGEPVDPTALAAAIKSSSLTPVATPRLKETWQDENGVVLQWTKRADAEGFTLYRSLDGEIWEELAQLGASARYYCDEDVEGGVEYHYALVATSNADGYRNSDHSKLAQRVYISSSTISVSKKKTTARISWEGSKAATGYTLEYAPDMFFTHAKTLVVDDGSTLSASVSGLSKDKPCYARIRAEHSDGTSISYAPWSYSSNMTESKTAELTQAKTTKKVKAKKGKKKKTKTKAVAFELRRAAKQKVGSCDTLQGSCAGGGYGYFVLNDRNTAKNKVVKVRLDKMKVVKVSKTLPIHHANDLTYNSKTHQVIAVHSTGDQRGLSVIDADTLKIKETVKLNKSVAKLFDATHAGIEKISGITSIAYNAKRDCYIATIRGTHDMLELDADFKATRVVALDKKSKGMYQNIEVGNDVIGVSTSANAEQGGNYLWVYSWSGKFLCKVLMPQPHELEGVFLSGGKLYAGFYVSGQKEVRTFFRTN